MGIDDFGDRRYRLPGYAAQVLADGGLIFLE